jgi:hypothetical protein
MPQIYNTQECLHTRLRIYKPSLCQLLGAVRHKSFYKHTVLCPYAAIECDITFNITFKSFSYLICMTEQSKENVPGYEILCM